VDLTWPWTGRENPPDLGTAFLQLWRVPFSSAYFGTEFHALAQVSRKIAMFLVLGALVHELAVRSPTTRTVILGSGVVLCTALGLAIELVQARLQSHVPDITDVGLYNLGFIVGILLMKRLHLPKGALQQAGE
jgi:glycopeptide antibiotics resistance protein